MNCMNIDLPWDELLYYDETSPSGLRWRTQLRRGSGKGYVFRNVGDVAGSFDKDTGYWEIFYRYRTYKAHRIIWILLTGDIDPALHIDHKDGNRTNNKIENLQLVSRAQNARNQCSRSTNTSGKMGVSMKHQDNYVGWSASWVEDGKQKSKTFSIMRYGYEGAYRMAVDAREDAIKKLNISGAGYSDRHGLEERFDKTESDSYDDCVAQLEAAKQGE